MQKFLLTYHGKPDFEGPEDGAKHMEDWKAWSTSLGSAMVDPGLPVGPSTTITPTGVVDGGGSNPVSGITIIQAETLADAIALAQGCPHLSGSGTIGISPALDLEMK
ncbi:hypothetical protein [Pseudophaeobacter sp.]|uniref:YciI family protein n=1 Tax=Pseudophaeobacter sp. TaxID=1971739 RepID=UPI003298F407